MRSSYASFSHGGNLKYVILNHLVQVEDNLLSALVCDYAFNLSTLRISVGVPYHMAPSSSKTMLLKLVSTKLSTLLIAILP